MPMVSKLMLLLAVSQLRNDSLKDVRRFGSMPKKLSGSRFMTHPAQYDLGRPALYLHTISSSSSRQKAELGHPISHAEGPVKTLVLLQAGFNAIGLNGVWGTQDKAYDGSSMLRQELLALSIHSRKVYLALDVDTASDPHIRHAEIRLFFLLRATGAQVYQLSSWQPRQGKGIDDFLVNRTEESPS